MAPHSSTLAWKIRWTEEPARLQSMGSRRVGHDWVTSLSLFTFMHWRRKWLPTPVFLPGESQGRGSLVAAVYGVAQSRTRLKWLSSRSNTGSGWRWEGGMNKEKCTTSQSWPDQQGQLLVYSDILNTRFLLSINHKCATDTPNLCSIWIQCATKTGFILKLLRLHLEKAMATHSSTLAWKIPWTKEPGRL